MSASTSVEATIHSTDSAWTTIASVRGWSGRPQYDNRRLRSERAFPTYVTRPSASRKRYAPGTSGIEDGSGRLTLTPSILWLGSRSSGERLDRSYLVTTNWPNMTVGWMSQW